MFLQNLSTPLLLAVLIVVIVTQNEATGGHRGHTNWWDHSRRRTETYQRQYLSRAPKGHYDRGHHSSKGQGHSLTNTYRPGQGHESTSGHNSQGSTHHQNQNILTAHLQSQGHQKSDQSHHTTRDNVGQSHYPNRDNVDQGHNADRSHHTSRSNTGRTHHATRDNVRRSHYPATDNAGHHTTGDNAGQSHNIHHNRDNAAQDHNIDRNQRDNVDQSRHANRDNVDHTTATRGNVHIHARRNTGQGHHATRENVVKGQTTNRENVDYTSQGHTRQSFTYQSQHNKGESSPQCTYSFVVNELDSSKCPMLLQELQKQQQQNNQHQSHQRTQTHNFQNDQDILTKYYENMNMNKEIQVLIQRIDTLENKLLREVAKNRELENDMLELENTVKRQKKVVDYHNSNITNIATVVKRGEIMQQKQMGYWKNVDTKLSGVMLDVVELHNRLDRQDSIMQLNDEAAKSIYVQSTGQQTCTGVQNATKFKDCEDIYHNGHKRSGVYYITPIYTSCPIPVYCDMETPPGGWLVIQRRMDGSVSFNKTWGQYRHGFGNVGGEHWIGNDNLFLLTNQLHYALRVDLYDFYNSRVYAEYKYFKVDGERDRYKLHVGNHTGTAPDGLGNHDNVFFSTPDQDHDEWVDYHCAKEWAAGWWFNNCWFVILNGPYYNITDVKYRGISWNDWKSEQLKHVEMKIRPAGF